MTPKELSLIFGTDCLEFKLAMDQTQSVDTVLFSIVYFTPHNADCRLSEFDISAVVHSFPLSNASQFLE